MDIFAQIADRIINEQQNIIGPVALEQAQKVPGLTIDIKTHTVTLEGNKKEIIEKLFMTFHDLFGPASDYVSKSAVREMITQVPKDQIPQVLL